MQLSGALQNRQSPIRGCKFPTCRFRDQSRQDEILSPRGKERELGTPVRASMPCAAAFTPSTALHSNRVHRRTTRAGSPDTEVSSQGASANVAHHHPWRFRRAAQRTQVSGEFARCGFVWRHEKHSILLPRQADACLQPASWRAFCGSTFSSVLNQQDEILLPQRDTMEILSPRGKESGLGTPVRNPAMQLGVRQPGIGGRSTSVRPPRPPRGDFCRPRRWRAVCLHAKHRHPSLRKTQHPAVFSWRASARLREPGIHARQLGGAASLAGLLWQHVF